MNDTLWTSQEMEEDLLIECRCPLITDWHQDIEGKVAVSLDELKKQTLFTDRRRQHSRYPDMIPAHHSHRSCWMCSSWIKYFFLYYITSCHLFASLFFFFPNLVLNRSEKSLMLFRFVCFPATGGVTNHTVPENNSSTWRIRAVEKRLRFISQWAGWMSTSSTETVTDTQRETVETNNRPHTPSSLRACTHPKHRHSSAPTFTTNTAERWLIILLWKVFEQMATDTGHSSNHTHYSSLIVWRETSHLPADSLFSQHLLSIIPPVMKCGRREISQQIFTFRAQRPNFNILLLFFRPESNSSLLSYRARRRAEELWAWL